MAKDKHVLLNMSHPKVYEYDELLCIFENNNIVLLLLFISLLLPFSNMYKTIHVLECYWIPSLLYITVYNVVYR